MSPLRLTGSTSGYSQIDAPAVAGDQTFTLPGTGGTLDRLNRAGNVLQVVQGTTSTLVDVSSATYADSGLSASITPSSSSNKVLVLINQSAQYTTSSGSQYGEGLLRIVRASSSIVTNTFALYVEAANSSFGTSSNGGLITICYLDSPATTSSVTYKTQQAAGRSGAVGVMRTQASSNQSTITLMEIAA